MLDKELQQVLLRGLSALCIDSMVFTVGKSWVLSRPLLELKVLVLVNNLILKFRLSNEKVSLGSINLIAPLFDTLTRSFIES